jgi:hypothetical protein
VEFFAQELAPEAESVCRHRIVVSPAASLTAADGDYSGSDFERPMELLAPEHDAEEAASRGNDSPSRLD